MNKSVSRILILCAIFFIASLNGFQFASGTDNDNSALGTDLKSRDMSSLFVPTGGERMAHLNNLGYLKEALTSFYIDNNRFPSDMNEFLEWGVPLWPMNPQTGKPVMLKPEIDEQNPADYFDLSFNPVNEDKAQCSTMQYSVNKKLWESLKWPSDRYIEMVIANENPRKLLDTRSESSRFTSAFITIANGVLFHAKFNRMPETLEELTDYGFKVVLDNWHPVTDSHDENTPSYLEIGIDRDQHYMYQIWTAVEGEVRKIAFPYPDGAGGNLMAYAGETLTDADVDKLDKEVLLASWMTADEIKANGGGITIDEILNQK